MAYPRGGHRLDVFWFLGQPVYFFYLMKKAPHRWLCLSNVKPNAVPEHLPS